MSDLTYFQSCVGWPEEDVHSDGGLVDMIDNSLEVTRSTFLKHVSKESLREVEGSLGYESHPKRGMTMAGDWHVRYFRSKLHKQTVYYFKHSAIEYVFK